MVPATLGLPELVWYSRWISVERLQKFGHTYKFSPGENGFISTCTHTRGDRGLLSRPLTSGGSLLRGVPPRQPSLPLQHTSLLHRFVR